MPRDRSRLSGRASAARQPARATSPPAGSICLYTPSADPSGMGAHLLELAAEYARRAEVSVLAWPTAPGQHLLAAAGTERVVRVVDIDHRRDAY